MAQSHESSIYTDRMLRWLAREARAGVLGNPSGMFSNRERITLRFSARFRKSRIDLNGNKLAGIYSRYGVNQLGFILRYADIETAGRPVSPLDDDEREEVEETIRKAVKKASGKFSKPFKPTYRQVLQALREEGAA